MAYKLTPDAFDQAFAIYVDGTLMFGQGQAEKYQAGLEQTLTFLGDNPRAARERTEIDPPIRVHPFGSHVIIYRDVGDDAVILAIRHSRENWIDDPWSGLSTSAPRP